MSCTGKPTNKYDKSKGAKSYGDSGSGFDSLYEELASNRFFKWVPVIALIISTIALLKK